MIGEPFQRHGIVFLISGAVSPGVFRNAISAAISIAILWGLAACTLGKGPGNPSPVPTQVQEPTLTSPALPDLTIREISPELESGDVCTPVGEISIGNPLHLRVVVENKGGTISEPFNVQVNGVWQTVTSGLPAAQTVTLHFLSEYQQIDAWVDSGLKITESNEDNNRASQMLVTPTLSPACSHTPTPAVAYAGPVFTLEGHTAKVGSVAFSPDGNLLASGSVDNTMRLWRVGARQLLRTMHGHPFPVLTLAFSPNGIFLATGSTDSKVRLWRVSDGTLLYTLEGHAGWVTSLDFSRDGAFLVSCAQDFTVRIWRVNDGRLVQTIDEGMAQVNDVAFSPSAQSLAWGEADGTVRLRTLSGMWLYTMKGSELAATSVVFSPDGKWLVVGYADGTMRIWQVNDGNLLQVVKSHTKPILGLAFSPDGKWLVSGSEDATLRLWLRDGNVFQTTPVLIFAGHEGAVNSVSFSPKGTLIASGSDDGTLRIWEVPQ